MTGNSIPRKKAKIRAGFTPSSDAELFTGIPICRELRKRGHEVFIAIRPNFHMPGVIENILKEENEEYISFKKLTEIDLNLILFSSTAVVEAKRNKIFRFDTIPSISTHERDYISYIYVYAGSNFAMSPNIVNTRYYPSYKGIVPVIGIPGADLFKSPRKDSVYKKDKDRQYILYPDSSPYHKDRRKMFFELLESLAQQYPEYDFIIKKRLPDDGKYVHFPYYEYDHFVRESTPINLKIIDYRIPTYRLGQQAHALIGLQSGALTDAMVAGVPIIMLGKFPVEWVDGVMRWENEFFDREGLRIDYREVGRYLCSPPKISSEAIRKEIPYSDASSRVVDVLECIYENFDGDDRLPWVKFDFEYSESFDKEICRIRESVKRESKEWLRKLFDVRRKYHTTVSALGHLIKVVNPEVTDEDFSDFLRKVDYHDELMEIILEKNERDINQFIQLKRMNGINSCIDRYYKEKNNEIIFNEYYLLEPYIAQYGYYVCKRLLDQKSEKAAARYYSLLEKKYHLARDALRKNGKKNHLFNYSTASLLEEMQKYDKASRIFESLLDEEDLKSHYRYGAYFHLGRIYHKLNKMQKSNQYLRKCLSIEPNHKMARVLMEENAKKLNSTLP